MARLKNFWPFLIPLAFVLLQLLQPGQRGQDFSSRPGVDAEAKRVLLDCKEDNVCLGERLQAITKARDAEFSLFVLDNMGLRNPNARDQAHNLAHEIGYAVYERFPKLVQMLSACRDTAASGCFHGVMMQYIGRQGLPTPERIAGACEEIRAAGGMLYFQCLHGLGHGTMMGRILNARGEAGFDAIRSALGDCDALRGDYEQQSCYGGTFMEYLVAARYQIFHYPVKPKYRDDDINWPCSELDERYVAACYTTQGRIILDAKKWNFREAFQACAEAPAAGRTACAYKIGLDILPGSDRVNYGRVVDGCRQALDVAQRTTCFTGAARNIVNYDGDVAEGLKVCKLGLEGGDRTCVDGVVGDARFLKWDEARITRVLAEQGLDR